MNGRMEETGSKKRLVEEAWTYVVIVGLTHVEAVGWCTYYTAGVGIGSIGQ